MRQLQLQQLDFHRVVHFCYECYEIIVQLNVFLIGHEETRIGLQVTNLRTTQSRLFIGILFVGLKSSDRARPLNRQAAV